MSRFEVADLPWLRPVPPDFRRTCKEMAAAPAVSGASLRDLSDHAHDLNGLIRLAKVIQSAEERIERDGALSPVSLGLLSSATTDYLAPAIVASGPRHGILPNLFVAEYGQFAQEVFGDDTPLQGSKPDAVLLAFDPRALGFAGSEIDPGAAEARVADALYQVANLAEGIRSRVGASVVLQTLAVPPEPWCGHYDRRVAGALASMIASFNDRLARFASESGSLVLDVAALADLVGRVTWHDHAQWHSAKLPFALELTPLYADHVARLLAALRGKARKCLVLDLDNTIWGGVIGDDGLEGIRIGQGSAEGEAFLAVQAYALGLKKRGVILAVCSKNEEENALQPFREHPDMLLREEDIAVFVANWQDKATNVREIARRLNIGTDALVFLDDNPAERARIRQMLPEVAVPEVPEDPAFYPAAVAHSGFFETISLSAEDFQRAESYRANAARTSAMEKMGSLDEYLASLDMVCDLAPFDTVGRARITQLTNKSNQFNLTTRRYTEREIEEMETDPRCFTLQVRLTDKFGDNGMISVVVFKRTADDPEAWECDTWLMSCRVLGRRVEEAALAAVVGGALEAGARRLIGLYLPTAKNKMVADHFGKLGFVKISEEANGSSRWQLDLSEYERRSLPMRLTGALAPESA